ncbi:MAG: Gfo/Idh/MocA family protein, partial [Anaerolineales bacterium]
MSEQSFTAMAGATARDEAPEIGIGMLGYAFMGKAHTNAFKKIPYMMYPPPAIPRLVAIAGRNEEAVAEAAKRYGYETYYTGWRDMIADDRVQLFDNGGPNDAHAEPCIAAARAGKHVLCEKPLARNAEEAKSMLDAVEKAGVKHMVAFNYRFVPAVVQARALIKSGALGQIYHFRAQYLQEWIMPHYNTPMIWRLRKETAGSGALGDLGAHIIDLGRFLAGEVKSVSAMTRTFIPERPEANGSMGRVTVDDAFVAAVEFENGVIGTLEATRFAAGHKNGNMFEVNGEKGSIRFNLERMNELEVFWVGTDPKETQGFTNVLVTEGYHPYWEN